MKIYNIWILGSFIVFGLSFFVKYTPLIFGIQGFFIAMYFLSRICYLLDALLAALEQPIKASQESSDNG